ncbi:MAG: DUF4870 domain-containing protein [Vicinamibacterales bacterium]
MEGARDFSPGPDRSSTGLSPRVAATLAYSGWWLTGLLFWFVERRDPVVRFHASQAVVAFGALALIIVGLSALALASLSFAPAAFDALVLSVQLVLMLSLVLWAATILLVASGRDWRIPLAATWADRLART